MDNKLEKIKELRKRTLAGFSDIKKALEASGYDMDKAIEWLRQNGIAKAAKKGGIIASEGIVNIKENDNFVILYEVNSQTDFVSKNDKFLDFVDQVGDVLINADFTGTLDSDDLKGFVNVNNESIEDLSNQATSIIGEKISVRRVLKVEKNVGEVIGWYLHHNKRIGSIFVVKGQDLDAANNVAMHIASSNPEFLDEKSLSEKILSELKEEIMNSSTLASKPENIRENIAKGMLRKKVSEITLLLQEFFLEKMSVQDYLTKHNLLALQMFRFEAAEGIEKKVENFADEVKSQMS